MTFTRAPWSVVPHEDLNTATRAWLTELHSDFSERVRQPDLFRNLSAVCHSSRFLTRLLTSDSDALHVLEALDHRAEPPIFDTADATKSCERLVAWKRQELLRIAARDLTGIDTLEVVGKQLADLATDVLRFATVAAYALHDMPDKAQDLVVIGMGKLGAGELNYSSDIDIMFAGSCNDRVAKDVLRIASTCFRVDANLRPEGRSGALVRTRDSFVEYWNNWAHTWEFQALIKANSLVGNPEERRAFDDAVASTLWSQTFDADALRSLRIMKAQSEALSVKKAVGAQDLKRSPGGIRDIEFSLQLLQLVHAKNDATLRTKSTLDTLAQLEHGGYIAAEDAEKLGAGYRFLRTVEHRLQLVDEQQTHTLPNARDERLAIATAMGFDGDNALSRFEDTLRQFRTNVRETHERMYFRPLLEAFSKHGSTPSESIVTQLHAFGFKDATRTHAAIQELTRGLARSSRLMAQMMPLLLEWLSESPDPDEGLLGLRNTISGFRTPTRVVAAFRDSPEVAKRLCLLLGTAKTFARTLTTNPELFDEIDNDRQLLPTTSVLSRLSNAVDWRASHEERYASLVRIVRLEVARIAIADIVGIVDAVEAGRRRTEIAEATLSLALKLLDAPKELAIIGMGRFGGAELDYASDLDVIAVYDGSGDQLRQRASDVTNQLVALVGNTHPNLHLYDIDLALRPEGKQGVVARSLESCVEYYEHWGETWERQALVRARPVGGNIEVGSRFCDVIEPFVWQQELTVNNMRDIRMLKARMERERIPRGEDPSFHLKLGKGSLSDVEWTTQLLQLQLDIRETNTLRALELLECANELSPLDHEILRSSWIFCTVARNRSHLIDSTSGDALPSNIDNLRRLARSLNIADLRGEYRRVTRRARETTERLFYGNVPENQQ